MAVLDANDPINKKDLADKAKVSEERRLDKNKAFSLANSQAAHTAPDRVPDKVVREEDRETVQGFHQKAVDAAKKNPEFLDRMPTLYDLLGGIANPKELDNYSYQADLYDAVPKFNWAPVKREIGKYLPIIKRDFQHQGQDFYVELTPARVGDKDHYPGKKEEFIEMILVQMAFERGMPMLGGYYGVTFSLYELRKRLKEKEHTYSIMQIKEALYIMNGTMLEVKTNNGKGESLVRESLFSSIGLRTWDDWKSLGRTSECFVRFNSLHVEALKGDRWRLYNENTALSLGDELTMWIYKRVSREWTGLKFLKTMKWRLSSIIRDSGIQDSVIGRVRKKVEIALNDLRTKNVFSSWDQTEEKGGQKGTKLIDVIYEINPSKRFEMDMKRFNQLHRDSRPLKLS